MMGFGLFNNMHSGGYMGIGIIILIALVVFVIYKKGLFEKFGNEKLNNENAQSILAKRYATGEISKEEYEDKINVLNKL